MPPKENIESNSLPVCRNASFLFCFWSVCPSFSLALSRSLSFSLFFSQISHQHQQALVHWQTQVAEHSTGSPSFSTLGVTFIYVFTVLLIHFVKKWTVLQHEVWSMMLIPIIVLTVGQIFRSLNPVLVQKTLLSLSPLSLWLQVNRPEESSASSELICACYS